MTRFLLRGAAAMAIAAASAGWAQTTPAPAPATAAAAPLKDADPALWVVKDDDTTIYMLGTVHVLKPGLSWFDEAVKDAFDKSGEMVIEVIQPTDQEAAMKVMMPLAMDPDGPPLTEKLPAAARPKYAAAMTSLGMPPATLDKFEPWYASVVLGLLPLQKAGYDPASGVEMQLTAAAKTANKPVSALEGFEEQLGFFDNMPESDQIGLLVATVDEFGEIESTLDRMVERWGAGDPDALAKEMNDQLGKLPNVEKILLTDRNDRWADWIKTRLDKPGTVFMAVGAGHLAGKGSVQDALAKRGIKAERVQY
jgi:uncharacterized protein YbaP (TraB family)